MNDFKDFLNFEDLRILQNENRASDEGHHNHYENIRNKFDFYHDFPKEVELKDIYINSLISIPLYLSSFKFVFIIAMIFIVFNYSWNRSSLGLFILSILLNVLVIILVSYVYKPPPPRVLNIFHISLLFSPLLYSNERD